MVQIYICLLASYAFKIKLGNISVNLLSFKMVKYFTQESHPVPKIISDNL